MDLIYVFNCDVMNATITESCIESVAFSWNS